MSLPFSIDWEDSLLSGWAGIWWRRTGLENSCSHTLKALLQDLQDTWSLPLFLSPNLDRPSLPMHLQMCGEFYQTPSGRPAPSPLPAPFPGYPAPLSLLFCSSVSLTAEVRLSAWTLSTGLFLLALSHRVLLVLPMRSAPLFSSSPTPISRKPTSAQP